MLKFAFIFKVEGVKPENCQASYESCGCLNLIIGVPAGDAEKLVKGLAGRGFTMFNFCGGFSREEFDSLKAAVGTDARMSLIGYLPEDAVKISQLKSFKEYGLIIEGSEELAEISIKSDICNVYAYFIKDMDMAKDAAVKLVEKGVYFIEMCSWFDEAMTQSIVNTIGGKVPVGSAGIK